MLSKRFNVLAAVALAGAAVGTVVFAEPARPRAADVQRDLEDAMKGEALAYAKYMIFAREAREHGHPEVAALFERTANIERLEHFREHAQLAGVLGHSDADNLRSALEGEQYESTRMYPAMAERARKLGDKEAAARFAEIAKDETKHHDQFASALAHLGTKPASASPQRH